MTSAHIAGLDVSKRVLRVVQTVTQVGRTSVVDVSFTEVSYLGLIHGLTGRAGARQMTMIVQMMVPTS